MRGARKILADAVLTMAATVLLPRLALACPLCFAAAGPRAYFAYYLSTVMLSAMPFVLIGGVIGAAYLLRNHRDAPADIQPGS